MEDNDKQQKKKTSFQFAVVGNGLIGSAAGRYLSEWSPHSVVIIGPGEPPSDATSSSTVFSSHYDQGRLCRRVSRDPIWHVVNGQAVQNYGKLQQQSGIQFHSPVGNVKAACRSPQERQKFLEWIQKMELEQAHQNQKQQYRYFPAGDSSWKQNKEISMLEFAPECDVFYESGPSGCINPRQLIAAQNTIAQQHGATILSELVVHVEEGAKGVLITLANGETITAEKVLIASGAFTNFHQLLPEPIPLRYKTETTVWGTVSEQTAKELQSMPAVCYDITSVQPENKQPQNDTAPPAIDDLYMAPPLLYPDGTYKIKMGCNTRNETWPTTLEEIQEWFLRGNSDADLPPMMQALQGQLPKVSFEQCTSHRCIVTYTPSGYPTIDAVPSRSNSSRLFVAAGGNGTSAQGSDTLGQMAAGLMLDGRWTLEPFGISRDVFRATHQWGEQQGSHNNQKTVPSKAQQRAMALVDSSS